MSFVQNKQGIKSADGEPGQGLGSPADDPVDTSIVNHLSTQHDGIGCGRTGSTDGANILFNSKAIRNAFGVFTRVGGISEFLPGSLVNIALKVKKIFFKFPYSPRRCARNKSRGLEVASA